MSKKVPWFFVNSIVGVCALGGAIALAVVVNPRYEQSYLIGAEATSPTTWEKACIQLRYFATNQALLWYSEISVEMALCEAEGIEALPLVGQLENDPNGRINKILWEEQQKRQQKTTSK